MQRKKLPRTRSAEEICAEKVSNCDDLKGYASDSTVSHPATSQNPPTTRRKRKCKERGPRVSVGDGGGGEQPVHCKERCPRVSVWDGGGGGGEQPVHYTKEYKTSPPPRLLPLNLGIVRMKSTGSILNTPDCTPSSVLCESRESLLSETRHRRKTSAHHRPSRPEPSHNLRRRGSVDNGLGQVGRVCGACGGGISPCKPPRRGTKVREDSRPQGTLRCRHQSRSLKGEKDRSRKASHHDDDEEDGYVRKCSLNRSLSFSSVGDYEGTRARVHFEPIHSSTSGSKWIVYGFL